MAREADAPAASPSRGRRTGSAPPNLAEVAHGHAGRLANIRVRSATSTELVDAFFFQTDNHFPELEALAAELGSPETAGAEPAWANAPLETRRFHRLKVRAREIACDAVAAIVAEHPALATDEARAQAASALHAYVAGAGLMPYEPFLQGAQRSRYDVDALSRGFGVSYE